MTDGPPSGIPIPPRAGPALLIAAAVCGLLLLLAGRSSLWDRDEPRFSRAALEMAASGNYLYPTFNGELRPDKPILIYWLMQAPLALLGPVEAAVRLPAVLGAGAALLLTWFLGRRLLGAGALAGLAVLGTSALFLFTGSAATTDAVLLAWITAALFAAAAALGSGPRRGAFVLLALALAGALLTKGPVGLAIPLLVAALAWLLARGARPPGRPFFLFLAGGSAAALLLFLAWGLPANAATGGEFLEQGLGKHVVHRSQAPMEGHGGNFFLYLPYYLLTPLLTFLPWTLFLPGALSALIGGRTATGAFRALLLAWIAAPVALMTLVSTKLPHYILPIWPALALATGALLPAQSRGALAPRDLRLLRAGAWLFAPPALLLALGLAAAPWFLPLPSRAKLEFPAPAALLAALSLMALRRHLAKRFLASAGLLCCWSVALMLSAAFVLLPAVESLRPVKPLARALAGRIPEAAAVHVLGYREPSLLFYLGTRRVERLRGSEEALRWPALPGPGVLIAPRTSLEALWPGGRPPGVEQLAARAGYDFSRGRPIELVALGKGFGRPGG